MALIQLEMISRVSELALNDDKISATLMYGSFIKNEGDKFSDIEFYVFYRHDFNHEEWVSQIRPIKIFFQNEFGTEVAIFNNMIRGEFHFSPVDHINIVKSWEGHTSFEHADQMILVDKEGQLEKVLNTISKKRPLHNGPDNITWLAKSLLNNLLMVRNVLKRGELAHAQQGFQFIQKYLLWLIRLADKADNHWENPTKKLEQEISKSWYDSYTECVPSLNNKSLNDSLAASIRRAEKLFDLLNVPQNIREVLSSIKEMP